MKTIAFIIPQSVEILDLAGPLQVFTEAKSQGLDIEIKFYSYQKNIISSSGLPFNEIESYKNAQLVKGDFIFLPGVHFEGLKAFINAGRPFMDWLVSSFNKQVNLCSVCNATFVLGKAGLLENRKCTTHWKRIEALQGSFPKAIVISDVLYVKSKNIYTSAGVSTGIDLALSILEELTDPLFVNKVAQSLVLYYRRNSTHSQQSIYLNYRNHVNPKIHQIQDSIIENLSSEIRIYSLAENVGMSPRNLSRVFKSTTKMTIGQYVTQLRIEKAKTLRHNPNYTMDYIASKCGYKSARQLQRILKINQ